MFTCLDSWFTGTMKAKTRVKIHILGLARSFPGREVWFLRKTIKDNNSAV